MHKGAAHKKKTHIVPVDALGTLYFSERSGTHVSSIIRCKNTKNNATTIMAIDQGSFRPPYRLENRSTDHTIIIAQDDDNAEPVVLEPLSWRSFAFDNPHGALRVRAVCGSNWQKYGSANRSKLEGDSNNFYFEASSPARTGLKKKVRKSLGLMGGSRKERILKEIEDEEKRTQDLSTTISDDNIAGVDLEIKSNYSDEIQSIETMDTLATSVDHLHFSSSRQRARCVKRLWGKNSRGYNIDRVGPRKNLPCPSPSDLSKNLVGSTKKFRSSLLVEVRILHGTKVVSFNDSPYRIQQSKIGQLKSGGDWKGVDAMAKIEGLTINLIDDQPKELLSVCMREFELSKSEGDIQFVCRLRHMQVDNMVDGARYPIVLQPASDSIDDRITELAQKDARQNALDVLSENGVAYWEQYALKPKPLFEMSISYLPLAHMMWIPNLEIFLNPLKLQVDLAYILDVVEVIESAKPDTDDTVNDEDIEEAYSLISRTMPALGRSESRVDEGIDGNAMSKSADEIGGSAEVAEEISAYVESLSINHTYLGLELFLRQDDKEKGFEVDVQDVAIGQKGSRRVDDNDGTSAKRTEGNEREGEGDGSNFDKEEFSSQSDDDESEIGESMDVSTLNTIGRNTNSNIGASLLTWITNVASR